MGKENCHFFLYASMRCSDIQGFGRDVGWEKWEVEEVKRTSHFLREFLLFFLNVFSFRWIFRTIIKTFSISRE